MQNESIRDLKKAVKILINDISKLEINLERFNKKISNKINKRIYTYDSMFGGEKKNVSFPSNFAKHKIGKKAK